MKRVLIIVLTLFVLTGWGKAQHNNVYADSRVDQLLQKHIESGSKVGKLRGFRVQIFFDSGVGSRANAERVKSSFETAYKNVPAYLTFSEPNFRVRVGNFRTRMEARCFLEKIRQIYTGAFVVKDDIEYPLLSDVD